MGVIYVQVVIEMMWSELRRGIKPWGTCKGREGRERARERTEKRKDPEVWPRLQQRCRGGARENRWSLVTCKSGPGPRKSVGGKAKCMARALLERGGLTAVGVLG